MSARTRTIRPARITGAAAPKITPFLWFGGQAEQAAKHYTAIFPRSRIRRVTRYAAAAAAASGQPEGSVMTVDFELAGRRFCALNGGPIFKFTEAVSFVIHCRTQAEIDAYWTRLSAGGEPGQCGWLKDKYGLSWQVVPANLAALLHDQGAAKARRVMRALIGMTKLDLAVLQNA